MAGDTAKDPSWVLCSHGLLDDIRVCAGEIELGRGKRDIGICVVTFDAIMVSLFLHLV